MFSTFGSRIARVEAAAGRVIAIVAVVCLVGAAAAPAAGGQWITEVKRMREATRRSSAGILPPGAGASVSGARGVGSIVPGAQRALGNGNGIGTPQGRPGPRPIGIASIGGGDLFVEGHDRYLRGELIAARDLWARALAANPSDVRARVWLQSTEGEHARLLERERAELTAAGRARQRQELLNSPITVRTDRPLPLTEFMRIISFSTAQELSYFVADGAASEVYGNFVDQPLGELLDVVLEPIGLAWEMDGNNFLTIRSRLSARSYTLTPGQIQKVRALLDAGVLQRVIWGQAAAPSAAQEIQLDERSRTLTIVGSEIQAEKLENFIGTLSAATTPDLETRIYRIRPALGPRIKSMIDALITSSGGARFDLQRDIIVSGGDLIVRDTPENIIKIEELLLDERFMGGMSNQQLEIVNFSLVPRNLENVQADELQVSTARVVEAVKTFLYARTGEELANSQGRRLWYDPGSLQLTLVDSPDNLSRVGSYLNSLPELRQERLEKAIAIKHANADELATEIAQILGIDVSGGGAAQGEEMCKRLSRGDQFEFQGLRIRLVRVEPNDPLDQDDDSAELSLVTGTQSSTLVLRELDTIFFEQYELTAERVNPSGGSGAAAGGGTRGGGGGNTGRRGEGTAEICVRLVPGNIPPIP